MLRHLVCQLRMLQLLWDPHTSEVIHIFISCLLSFLAWNFSLIFSLFERWPFRLCKNGDNTHGVNFLFRWSWRFDILGVALTLPLLAVPGTEATVEELMLHLDHWQQQHCQQIQSCHCYLLHERQQTLHFHHHCQLRLANDLVLNSLSLTSFGRTIRITSTHLVVVKSSPLPLQIANIPPTFLVFNFLVALIQCQISHLFSNGQIYCH